MNTYEEFVPLILIYQCKIKTGNLKCHIRNSILFISEDHTTKIKNIHSITPYTLCTTSTTCLKPSKSCCGSEPLTHSKPLIMQQMQIKTICGQVLFKTTELVQDS